MFLSDLLLLHFDLIFVFLNHLDPNIDRKIAAHVILAPSCWPSGPGAITAIENDDSDDDFDGNDSEDEHQNGPLSFSDPSVW